MALPKIDLPTYRLYLHSLEREIVYRPFIVKEEKILLMALESEDFNTVLDSIKHVIQNCVLEEDFDIDTLPLFEIEFIFLNLRARSMGETVSLTYICRNKLEENKTCRAEMEVVVDILKAALEMTPQESTVMISKDVGIKLKYPTLEISKVFTGDNDELNASVELIAKCTEYLFDEEQMYKVEDMRPGEFQEFIDNLTQEQFIKIQKFFDNIPKIKYETQVACGSCGKVHDIKLEGILDFFE